MSVLFFTGAGISANAGIATYRDGSSSWKDADLEAKSHANRYGNHLDELWDKHWGPMQQAMNKAEPTHAHKAIAAFQEKHESIIATQNIDNLHERAGSNNIAHLHGVMDSRCMRCKKNAMSLWVEDGAPVCTDCGSKRVRPDVVLFGEMLSSKMMKGLERFVATEARYVISVGSSLNVFPAAGLVFDALGKLGKTTIIINKEPTAFDKWATHVYHDDADAVIDDVLIEVDSALGA